MLKIVNQNQLPALEHSVKRDEIAHIIEHVYLFDPIEDATPGDESRAFSGRAAGAAFDPTQ